MYRKFRQQLENKEEEGDNEIVTSCWNEIEQQCEAYKPSAIKQGQQSSGWKVIRVFVSSTFTDFFNEREILVKKVFPELREWCSTRHIHLIECDLRWGVPREATTQDVISTCFEELNRCHKETDGQPFFLGLLGKRYGWIPGKEDLSDEIKQKFQWVNNTSITFMEILHGAYRCKSPNAVFFLRSDDIVKSLPEPSLKRFVDKEPINQHHILELKNKIKSRFPDQFYEYNCKVDGTTDVTGKEKVKLSELDQFSEKVTEFFKTAITNMYGDKNSGKFDEEDMERENQRLYIENKSELVVGQDQLLETLKSYLQGEPLKDVTVSKKSKAFVRDPEFWGEPLDEDNMILCLKGHPGFGKSTLLSKVVGDSIKEGYDIFYHFVGCSASSKNTEFMYTRLLRALEERIHGEKDKENKPKENSLKDLMTRMKELLPKLREQQTKLIIILDAVNELPDSDTYNHLSWLPPRLPGNIKCIISSADDNPPTIARLTEHTCYICDVGPITKEAAELIVTHSLNKFNKKLDSDQLSLIVSRPCANNPLWLKILSEELRIFGDFRTLDMKIDQISDSVESLLTEIIGRLMSEDNTGLVKKALYLLVCSIGGIKTQDLCNMLGDINNKEPVAPLYWSQTRRVLKPYIKEIGIEANISFYHMEIYKSVSQVLLGKQNSRTEWYKILAMYYTKWCPDERSRSLYAPTYCMNANLKSELVDFFTNDTAARHVPTWKRSQCFQNIRCKSLADSIIPQCTPVVLCQTCSNKSTDQIFRTRNQDCCVVCKGRLIFSKIPANLCSFHSFGSNVMLAKCLYCDMRVPKENGQVKTHMGTIGKLCTHCGFGNYGKSCAMVLTK